MLPPTTDCGVYDHPSDVERRPAGNGILPQAGDVAMMRWIDRTLFDDLVLTNSEQAEAMIRNVQSLLSEVLPSIPDAVMQYGVYHDRKEYTNSLDRIRICFERNGILFDISKQTYPKHLYRIHCCSDDTLQHVDNYSTEKAREGLTEPQRIGKLSKLKVEEWVAYQTQYYRNLVRIDEENGRRIREHLARLEQIPDVFWSWDKCFGTIERHGLCYSFRIERTLVSENIRLSCCGRSLDEFLDMARPYDESETPDKS